MAEPLFSPEEKIVDRDGLALRMQDRGGLVYVFTNGCFDILHRGHAEYLCRARALGDRLVVAVNSDRSVRALKGEPRPYVSEGDRAFLVASLASVDYVTIFNEPTPVELLDRLRPDIHVKGGDYSLDRLPEAAVVRGYGGRVVILPFVDGRSSSGIIDAIRRGI